MLNNMMTPQKLNKTLLVIVPAVIILMLIITALKYESGIPIVPGKINPVSSGAGSPLPSMKPEAASEKLYNNDEFVLKIRKKYIPETLEDTDRHKWGPEKEESAIREAVKKNPGNKDVLYLFAYNRFDSEKYDEAADAFNEILRITPNEERALQGLIYSHYNGEDFERAGNMLEAAMKLYPRNTTFMHIHAGIALNKEQNYDKAVSIYRKAIEIEPENFRLWLGLGESYLEMRNEEGRGKGIDVLQECIAKFPEYHIAYIVLAEEYQSIGEYEKAAVLLEKAIKLDPGYYQAYALVGDMMTGMGKYLDAEWFYRRALSNPRHEKLVNIKLGRMYRYIGKPDMAEEFLKKALEETVTGEEKKRERAMVYLELSRVESERGNMVKSKDYLDKAFRTFPSFDYNNYYLSLWYLDQGEYDTAEKAVRKCFQGEDPDESVDPSSLYYGLAMISAGRGDMKKAGEHLESASQEMKKYRLLELMNRLQKDKAFLEFRKSEEYRRINEKIQKETAGLKSIKIDKELL